MKLTLRTVTGALALAVVAPMPAAYAAPGNASVEEPEVEVPAPEQPVPEQPVPEQPVPEQPAPEEPEVEVPVPEQPVPEHPAPEQPVPEEPEVEVPVPEQPAPEQPAPEQPEVEVPTPEQVRTEAPALVAQQRDPALVTPQMASHAGGSAPAQGLPHSAAPTVGGGAAVEYTAEPTVSSTAEEQATDEGSTTVSPSADGPKHRVIDAGAAGPMDSGAPWAEVAAALGLVTSMVLVALGLKTRRHGRHAE